MTTINRTCQACFAFMQGPENDETNRTNLHSLNPDRAAVGELHSLNSELKLAGICNGHLTQDNSSAADDAQSETARNFAESTPEFLAAMDECQRLTETLGIEHPETSRAVRLAIQLAPESLTEQLALHVLGMRRLPEAYGYTDNGEPVYSMESAAAFFGLTLEEAQSAVDAMFETLSPSELPALLNTSVTVHRMH